MINEINSEENAINITNIKNIINKFYVNDEIKNSTLITNGTVNMTTFHIGLNKKYILQRINPTVFKKPIKVMENIKEYNYIAKKVIGSDGVYNKWIVPNMYYSEQNQPYYIDELDNLWRLYDYIDGNVYVKPVSLDHVSKLGIGLAKMHSLLKALNHTQINSFSEHFHDICYYYKVYKDINDDNSYNDLEIYCKKMIDQNCRYMIKRFNEHSNLTKQIIHGDPKIGNMVFHKKDNSVITFIDLDTLYYAPLVIDICDCLRSITNVAGDTPIEYDMVEFDVQVLKTFLKAYMETELVQLSDYDIDSIYFYLKLLPFELGLRFFSDYLKGSEYFPVKNKTDNLYKAVSQFKLFEEISNSNVEVVINDILRRGYDDKHEFKNSI